MEAVYLLSIGLFLLLFLGLGLGALFGRSGIKGSCGGVGADPSGECPVCGQKSGACQQEE